MKIRNRVDLEVENQLARVTLQRPEKHNALDLEMFRAITEAQQAIAADRSVRAVVLSGAGIDFCTGLDVKSIMRNRRDMLKLLWKWFPWRANLAQQVSVGWRQLPVPVIAAIHGRCWGGGLQIALGADFRIVQPDASLSIMEARWGLVPDMGGTLALRELLERDQAMWLTMTAEQLSGSRALELGLATMLADEPGAVALERARKLMQNSPDAIAATKRLFRKSWSAGAGKALARESYYQVRILRGSNQRTAVRRQTGEETEFGPALKW
ncbi:MAG: crotonase/enoyl-CoA hydratase family protein [Xanthomonadales bacterium]|nr:crotonase/enoyl-CoA hydratase family protein [Gammaproteobacteria bacterium]MBT8053993.1 crotonase/enoyl-CoA hydratase family protein [Gammaproteobacteria bacterium]NND56727.1 crotonase/enoyl-CoA hydratase family protein [Xanthomonadales bacterium]NNK51955.1 crotonase/enoyl-CoA hydratase family protein [Xanthomonadales bacterium]